MNRQRTAQAEDHSAVIEKVSKTSCRVCSIAKNPLMHCVLAYIMGHTLLRGWNRLVLDSLGPVPERVGHASLPAWLHGKSRRARGTREAHIPADPEHINQQFREKSMMRMKLTAAALVAMVPFTSGAATSVVIDAKANCLSSYVGRVSGGTPVKLTLAPGRYAVSLTSNTMSCSGGSLTNGCNIGTVLIQGGYGSIRWGGTVTASPTVVEMTTAIMHAFAYVSDDYCGDNSGQATLLVQPAN
ncbi:hypothetical protein [Burkholderia multivorans]|uniref:hypothetical protein n=1 Tax=Burkholderia multivorans TaxID=87883 RepID=UPI0030C8AD07